MCGQVSRRQLHCGGGPRISDVMSGNPPPRFFLLETMYAVYCVNSTRPTSQHICSGGRNLHLKRFYSSDAHLPAVTTISLQY